MATATDTVDEEYRLPLEIWLEGEGDPDSKLWTEYLNRLAAGRDMHVVVTAGSETGVGKTTLAYALCMLGDPNGWHVGKATLDPAEYAHLYDKRDYCERHEEQDEVPLRTFENCSDCQYALQPGSWLLADEWEQAVDARSSMSKVNKEASHQVATKRYRQIFAVYTAPSKSWMDNRFSEDAIDFWIKAEQDEHGRPKGEASVYRVKNNEHRGASYTEGFGTISWPKLDHHAEFRKLERLKKERMEGDIRRTYIHRDEFEEAKKNFWKKATQKTRYHIVKAMVEYGISQTDTAEILQQAEHVEGLSQQRVSQMVNTERFEDAYNT